MSDEIVLYHYWRSSCSWRVRWALNLKKIPHRLVHIDILKGEQSTPEYLEKNPRGFVPTMFWKGAYYSESLAMLEGLDEAFPENPLMPNDTHSRMLVTQLTHVIASGTQPLQNTSFLNFLSSDPAKKKEITVYAINKGLSNYERLLERFGSGTFSFGSQLTIADLTLIPQCYNALRNDIDLNAYPLIHGIYKRCLATEACRKAAPENYKP